MEIVTKKFNVGEVPSRLEIDVEDFTSLSVTYIGGTVAITGASITYEASLDSSSKETGSWATFSGQRSNDQQVSAIDAPTLAISAAWGSIRTFNVSSLKRFRIRVSALTAGNFIAIVTLSKAVNAFIPFATQAVSGNVGISSITPGVTGSALGKTEDAPHSSGDVGIEILAVRNDAATNVITSANGDYSPVAVDDRGRVFTVGTFAEDDAHVSGNPGTQILGVRVPATPAAQTSAAGDYGSFAITAEGKQIMAGTGAEELAWDGFVTAATTTASVLKAAVAGVRNVLTDLTLDNSSTVDLRIIVSDGSTQKFAATVKAGTTFEKQFKTPLRGSVNTAWNVALVAANASGITVSAQGYLGV